MGLEGDVVANRRLVTVEELLGGRFRVEKKIDFGYHLEHYDEPDRSRGEAPAKGEYMKAEYAREMHSCGLQRHNVQTPK